MISRRSGHVSTLVSGRDECGGLDGAGQPARDHTVEDDALEQPCGGRGLLPSLRRERHVVGGDGAAALVEVRDRAVAHQVDRRRVTPR